MTHGCRCDNRGRRSEGAHIRYAGEGDSTHDSKASLQENALLCISSISRVGADRSLSQHQMSWAVLSTGA